VATDSILDSVKKFCNVMPDATEFDDVILLLINSAFSTLTQLGVGPTEGFHIEDSTPTWTDYLTGDLKLNNVKTYVSGKVKLTFDPPGTSAHLQALKEIVREEEWRLNVTREGETWVPPAPPPTEPCWPTTA
jgi:hypothetical protein